MKKSQFLKILAKNVIFHEFHISKTIRAKGLKIHAFDREFETLQKGENFQKFFEILCHDARGHKKSAKKTWVNALFYIFAILAKSISRQLKELEG